MEWKLFADLADAAGGKSIAVDVDPGVTVDDALEALFEKHPELEDRVLDDDGSVRQHINVLHNGSNVFTDGRGLDTELEPGDELALFPPVSGGSEELST